jgi:poly(beta-D-mannuronate) lyase
VQVAVIENNKFTSSRGLVIEHTVGQPITEVLNNVFSNTDAPLVTELVAKGALTAKILGNQVKGGK